MANIKTIHINGRAIAIHGNDIDTDRVIPARFLKGLTFSDLGEYPFYDERFDSNGKALDHPFNREASQGAALLFVNTNFGCGSSREHAPQSLNRWGIKGLVGVSFGEIFAGNCERLGVPATTCDAADIGKLQALADTAPETEWHIDLEAMTVSGGRLSVAISLPEGRRQSLIHGYWNTTDALVANIDAVRKVYDRLPYTHHYE
jgi:3-isopropylmalate/(R)-2-methylmalate dehydratase small subunit